MDPGAQETRGSRWEDTLDGMAVQHSAHTYRYTNTLYVPSKAYPSHLPSAAWDRLQDKRVQYGWMGKNSPRT